MMNNNPQLDNQGNLKHLLSIEGLNKNILTRILNRAETFFDHQTGELLQKNTLHNKTICNLFFEPSTRTRSTFELAASRLNARVLNFNIGLSATTKGESLIDTVQNLKAMQTNMFVLRHHSAGAAEFIAQQMGPSVSIINAGDGCHAHPTQALLDMYTIRKHRGELHPLTVAIIGDIKHSRVARSQIHALNLLGTGEIRIIAPNTLLPTLPESLGVQVFNNLKEGLNNVDVIMMLRLQRERMQQGLLPNGEAYFRDYGLTQQSLEYAKPNALIIHPGPVNRNIEIQSEVVDSPNAVILDQVTNGVAVRMAVMSILNDKNNLLGAN